MKSKKKFGVCMLSLLSLGFGLTGCGGNKVDYPNVTIRVRTTEDEVEVGGVVTVRATIGGADEIGANFTTENTDLISIKPNESGVSAKVTGLKEGEATIVVTAKANPTISRSIKLTVIPTRPSLRGALENIDKLNNYTFEGGEYAGDDVDFYPQTITKVTEDAIIMTDDQDDPVVQETSISASSLQTNNNDIVGVKILEDNHAHYLEKKGRNYITEDAAVARGGAGLIDKANLSGYAEKANNADDNPYIYGLRAINPAWVSDEKSEDNIYEIDGSEKDDLGYGNDVASAYVETLLWKLVDIKSYQEQVKTIGEAYPVAMAAAVETSITVIRPDQIQVDLKVGTKTYRGIMSNIGTTTIDSEADYASALDDMKGTKTLLPADLEKGKEALNTHNYVRDNYMYPDHSTLFHYSTYYTENYVFFDCNASFKEEYNNKRIPDVDEWTKAPYGYAKRNNAVYHFTYDETNKAILWDEKPEDTKGEDFYTYAKYVEAMDFVNTDLIYSFSDEEGAIWSGENERYHATRSYQVALDILNYFAPDDIQEKAEKASSGFGVVFDEKDATKVKTVNMSVGTYPFNYEGSTNPGQHSYGVDRFSFSSFGSGNANAVDALLNL